MRLIKFIGGCFEWVLENMYGISLMALIVLLWVDVLNLVDLPTSIDTLVMFGIPIFGILWKIDCVEKKLDKLTE